MGEYAPVTADWREPLLAGSTLLDVRLTRRDPAGWPGYTPAAAVRAYRLRGGPGRPGPVAVAWDFSVFGGSFGEDDATTLVAAARAAVRERVPLVTLVRSGGTRLQEGMAALVGIARARLALLALAEAGLPHLCVVDAPTTGGVWVSVGAAADLRCAVEGATVGFAGPRVVEAVTGVRPGPDSHTAESAYAAGLVDALLAPEQVAGWLAGALQAFTPEPVEVVTGRAEPVELVPGRAEPVELVPGRAEPTATTGWEQVRRARARTRGGVDLLAELLTDRVPLRARHGDDTVTAVVGRLAGRPVVGIALASRPRTLVTPDGYRLAARGYRLASRLGLPVLSLVDTPGAYPSAASEADGLVVAIGEAMDALLTCRTPTVSVVHGEGGSGGALAAAVTDAVLVMSDAYFAAIGPESAAATLRRPSEQCAELMGITPADLLALGAADEVLNDPWRAVAHLDAQSSVPGDVRRALRLERWSSPLPGAL